MEKYIDSLKLSAKKVAQPAGLLPRQKLKQPKKPKLTIEEFLEKTKKKPAKQSIQRPKTVSSAEKKKLKLLEEQYKALKKKLKKEQESKFSKSETQIKIEKEEEKEAKEKQAEKLQELALALKTVVPASAGKTVRQPFTILNNDLEFKKLTKKEQDDVKAYLKQFPKDKQLDIVNLYTSLALKDRRAFLSQASPLAPAPKGAISVVPPPPGFGAGPAPAAIPPPATPPPATPPPATPANVQKLLKDVENYKRLYFGTNRDKLDEAWDRELDIIIPILEQDPSREIDVSKVAEIQDELVARVDRPAPTAFIPPGVYASGQASLDADDEEAEELAQLAKQPSVIPQSAQQNIARTNAVAVSSGNQPTIIRQITPAGSPIPAPSSPVPASAPSPAPVVVPVVAKKVDYGSMKKDLIKKELSNRYTPAKLSEETKKLFPSKNYSKLNQGDLARLITKLKQDEAKQTSAEEEPETQAAQVTQLVDTSLIPVSAQLAQIPEAPEVVITPTDVDTTIADASAAAAPAPSGSADVTASGFASGLKKVKQMRGKKAHDKVVHIMAINNALHRGLNKVKKMHGGAMYNKVKSVLMRGGDVSSSGKTPADNTYIMFADLSEFVDSDFYKQNSSIITKYPPVKKIFNAVPSYKDYRIVVRSMGDNYHTVYTIDANENNFNAIIKTLVNMGGVNQIDYGKAKSKQADIQSTADVKRSIRQFNRGIQRGYQEGYEKQAEEEDNSPFASIMKGFMIPVSAAKELL